MALLNQIFNINNLPESTEYKVLPSGKYPCFVTSTDLKESMNTGSEYIALDWEITDGEYRGRHIFQNIIISHPTSPKAVEMGKMTIRKLLAVGGLNELKDTNDLLLMQADLVISTEQPSEKNGYQTQIRVKDILPHVNPPLPPKDSVNWEKYTQQQKPQNPAPNLGGFVSAKNIMEQMGFQKMAEPKQQEPVQVPKVQPHPQGGPEDFVGDNLDELMASATTGSRIRTIK